jgi:hypothetical protein
MLRIQSVEVLNAVKIEIRSEKITTKTTSLLIIIPLQRQGRLTLGKSTFFEMSISLISVLEQTATIRLSTYLPNDIVRNRDPWDSSSS